MNKPSRRSPLLIPSLIIIVLPIVLFVVLTSQETRGTDDEITEEERCIESYFDLEVICEKGARQICYDKNTNVLYYKFHGVDFYDITPIFNSDGTPKLYKEE